MKRQTTSKAQGGVMLIEALIAILIFSIGILSLVGMQTSMTKASGDAQYRTQASLLANDLIGRTWVGDNSSPTTLQANFQTGGTEYASWLAGVTASGLPLPSDASHQPSVVVDVTGATPVVTVTLYWSPPGEAGTIHQYVATAQIKKS